MRFDRTNLTDNMVMVCETEAQAQTYLEFVGTRNVPVDGTFFTKEGAIVLTSLGNVFAPNISIESIKSMGYTIYYYKDFDWYKTYLTKKQLQSGDVLFARNGDVFVLVQLGKIYMLVQQIGDSIHLSKYNDDLTHPDDGALDIIKIVRFSILTSDYNFEDFIPDKYSKYAEEIFICEPEVEMTIEEVSQALGRKVVIVPSKEELEDVPVVSQ